MEHEPIEPQPEPASPAPAATPLSPPAHPPPEHPPQPPAALAPTAPLPSPGPGAVLPYPPPPPPPLSTAPLPATFSNYHHHQQPPLAHPQAAAPLLPGQPIAPPHFHQTTSPWAAPPTAPIAAPAAPPAKKERAAQLTKEQRIRVFTLFHDAGWTKRRIREHTKYTDSQIKLAIRNVEPKPRPGRPRSKAKAAAAAAKAAANNAAGAESDASEIPSDQELPDISELAAA